MLINKVLEILRWCGVGGRLLPGQPERADPGQAVQHPVPVERTLPLNLLRPVLTAVLLVLAIPYMLRALS